MQQVMHIVLYDLQLLTDSESGSDVKYSIAILVK